MTGMIETSTSSQVIYSFHLPPLSHRQPIHDDDDTRGLLGDSLLVSRHNPSPDRESSLWVSYSPHDWAWRPHPSLTRPRLYLGADGSVAFGRA